MTTISQKKSFIVRLRKFSRRYIYLNTIILGTLSLLSGLMQAGDAVLAHREANYRFYHWPPVLAPLTFLIGWMLVMRTPRQPSKFWYVSLGLGLIVLFLVLIFLILNMENSYLISSGMTMFWFFLSGLHFSLAPKIKAELQRQALKK